VFAHGGPELFGVSGETGQAVDVVEFLWASLALFDGADEPDTATVHRPIPLALHTFAAARDRILRRLGEAPEGARLDQLLPEESPDTGDVTRLALRRRSGWAATFVSENWPVKEQWQWSRG
jgi:hypothetical protein